MTLADLKEQHADLVAALRKEIEEEAKASGEHAALVKERDDLKAKVTALELEKATAEKAALAAKLLDASKPLAAAAKDKDARKDILAALESCDDEEAMKARLATFEKAVAAVKGRPVSEGKPEAVKSVDEAIDNARAPAA